jgi:2-polyprenyl-3-methyl-5-hydroxy-6-metoxy-1,4-benzoquinol methylase
LTCSLVYAKVTESDIAGIYETDYYKSVYPDYESDKNIHELNNRKLLQKIEEYFPPGAIIEIGSAFGFFLDTAKKRGWKTLGYETSEYASSIAREKYHQNVRNESFLTANIQESVDVVCMFDTIEHLIKPSLVIEKAFHTINKGGGLILTTGDLSSWMARIFGKRWRMVVPPLHVYYYSPATITRLLRQYGFDVLSISHESKYQNFNSILQYQFEFNKNIFPQFPVRVNFGDIMLAIAIKV